MIKENYDPSSPSVIPVTNVVDLKDDSVVAEKPVRAEVKLKNSDVLANLDTQLSHLSVEKRDTITGLIDDFQDILPMFPRRQMQYNMM